VNQGGEHSLYLSSPISWGFWGNPTNGQDHKVFRRPKDKLTRMEKQALLSLQGIRDLTVLLAGKGSATVILST
jgi:hypothetical protein